MIICPVGVVRSAEDDQPAAIILIIGLQTWELHVANSLALQFEEVEEALRVPFDEPKLIDAGRDETRRIVESAKETVKLAGVDESEVGAVYFTGGTTGLRFLSDALASAFPAARPVFGDRLASVATGLGIYAQRVFA